MNPVRERLPLLLLLALCAAEICTSVEISMIHMAMPKIVSQYGDTGSAFWVITVYYLFAASSVTLSARLGDIFGRKKVLVTILSISLCGSVISAVTTSYFGLLFGRALTGAVSAAVPLSFGLIKEHFPASQVPMGIGVAAAVPAFAGTISMLLGGALIDNLPWRSIFLVSSCFTLFSIIAIRRIVPSSRGLERGDKPIDWLGGLLLVPCIVGLLGSLNLGKAWGWTHPLPVSVLVASLALLAFWIFHELRKDDPMVDLRLLSVRKIRVTNLTMALVAVGIIPSASVISMLLQQPETAGVGFGTTATMTALLFLPLSLVAIVAGTLSGRLAELYGASHAGLVGAGISMLAWCVIAVFHSNLPAFIMLFYLAVFGFSILYSALPNLIIEDAPVERASEVTGVTTVIRLISSAVGVQLVAFYLSWSASGNSPQLGKSFTSDQSFSVVFWFYAITTALGVLFMKSLRPTKRPSLGSVSA